MNISYDDIISLSPPTSAKHPRMAMSDRAAQFSAFQALSGYGEAIQERARHTEQKIQLAEEEQEVLDEKLRWLIDAGMEAVFTWFLPDAKKSGGAYVSSTGRIKRVDNIKHIVTLTDGAIIPVEDILEISEVWDKDDSY